MGGENVQMMVPVSVAASRAFGAVRDSLGPLESGPMLSAMEGALSQAAVRAHVLPLGDGWLRRLLRDLGGLLADIESAARNKGDRETERNATDARECVFRITRHLRESYGVRLGDGGEAGD